MEVPSLTIDFVTDTPVLAIDIGGTKLAAGVVTTAGEIVSSTSTPTLASRPGEDLYASLVEVAGTAIAAAGVERCDLAAVGVGCGGPMTLHGETVSPTNIWSWRGFPLRARLTADFERDVWIDNDAKALTLAEWRLGAGRGRDNFMGMVVSTGIGGGIILDGRLLDGRQGNAGHVGHINVEADGHLCGCGAFGCVEAEASGSAIARITGAEPRLADTATRERTGRLVGRAVAGVVNLLDIDLVAVAGSVALGFGETFFASAQAELSERARLDFAVGARIVPAELGSDAPLIGAAMVATARMESGT